MRLCMALPRAIPSVPCVFYSWGTAGLPKLRDEFSLCLALQVEILSHCCSLLTRKLPFLPILEPLRSQFWIGIPSKPCPKLGRKGRFWVLKGLVFFAFGTSGRNPQSLLLPFDQKVPLFAHFGTPFDGANAIQNFDFGWHFCLLKSYLLMVIAQKGIPKRIASEQFWVAIDALLGTV